MIPAAENEHLANARRILCEMTSFGKCFDHFGRLDSSSSSVPVFQVIVEHVIHLLTVSIDSQKGLIVWSKRKRLWNLMQQLSEMKQRARYQHCKRNEGALQALLQLSSRTWQTSEEMLTKSLEIEPRGIMDAKDLVQ